MRFSNKPIDLFLKDILRSEILCVTESMTPFSVMNSLMSSNIPSPVRYIADFSQTYSFMMLSKHSQQM